MAEFGICDAGLGAAKAPKAAETNRQWAQYRLRIGCQEVAGDFFGDACWVLERTKVGQIIKDQELAVGKALGYSGSKKRRAAAVAALDDRSGHVDIVELFESTIHRVLEDGSLGGPPALESHRSIVERLETVVDIGSQCDGVDHAERRPRGIPFERCIEAVEDFPTLPSRENETAFFRRWRHRRRRQDWFKKPRGSKHRRIGKAGKHDCGASHGVSDAKDRLVACHRLDCGGQVLGHSCPDHRETVGDSGVTVTSKINAVAMKSVGKRVGDGDIAAAVETGGVSKDENWTIAAEIVKRHLDVVGGWNELRGL